MSGEVDLCGWWTDLRDSSSATIRPSILISEHIGGTYYYSLCIWIGV